MPSTTGSVSRARRGGARRSARARARRGARQRRGHQHADERSLHRVAPRRAAPQRRRRRIACQAIARANIDAHIRARPARIRPGLEATSEAPRRAPPRCAAAPQRERARHERAGERAAAQRAQARARRPTSGGAGSRAAWAGARPGCAAAGPRARARSADRHAPARVAGAADAPRLLIGVEHLGGHVRPREALGALARGARHPRAGARRARTARSASASARASPGGHEPAVDAVAEHVAIAGDVRGDHRRARGEASVSTMPKLSPCSDGAHTRPHAQARRACAPRRPCPARARRGRRASCARPRRRSRRRA